MEVISRGGTPNQRRILLEGRAAGRRGRRKKAQRRETFAAAGGIKGARTASQSTQLRSPSPPAKRAATRSICAHRGPLVPPKHLPNTRSPPAHYSLSAPSCLPPASLRRGAQLGSARSNEPRRRHPSHGEDRLPAGCSSSSSSSSPSVPVTQTGSTPAHIRH